jgi:hypothetical protein
VGCGPIYEYISIADMKITPKNNLKADPFAGLSPLEQKTRKAAIAFVFVGVFFWAVKILFLA